MIQNYDPTDGQTYEPTPEELEKLLALADVVAAAVDEHNRRP